MNYRSIAVMAGLAAAMLVTACAATPETPMPPAEQSAAPPTLSVAAPQSPLAVEPPLAVESPLLTPISVAAAAGGVTGEAPQALLDLILDDAAGRTGLARSALQVIQDQAVVWSDGSLGCGQPGMVYTQALVEGYHVIVAAGDQTLDYRAGRNNSFRLCENPRPNAPGAPPSR
ncbi:hypothetical protein [Caldilinea sp.]|uniref:hypothetical protein n=1 Tax=Caldilinea sp. TaxID=2293560 RepID=UPI002CB6A8AA|nr:hypothetical protein [Anaerolineales bacterium]HQY90561.1 hypothetical protein [Caldilinea sp.]HRA68039.1 hypothetical protein [Caldilinea sp.]